MKILDILFISEGATSEVRICHWLKVSKSAHDWSIFFAKTYNIGIFLQCMFPNICAAVSRPARAWWQKWRTRALQYGRGEAETVWVYFFAVCPNCSILGLWLVCQMVLTEVSVAQTPRRYMILNPCLFWLTVVLPAETLLLIIII